MLGEVSMGDTCLKKHYFFKEFSSDWPISVPSWSVTLNFGGLSSDDKACSIWYRPEKSALMADFYTGIG